MKEDRCRGSATSIVAKLRQVDVMNCAASCPPRRFRTGQGTGSQPENGSAHPMSQRVKSGKARIEHNTSAFHPIATSERTRFLVGFVPKAEIAVRQTSDHPMVFANRISEPLASS